MPLPEATKDLIGLVEGLVPGVRIAGQVRLRRVGRTSRGVSRRGADGPHDEQQMVGIRAKNRSWARRNRRAVGTKSDSDLNGRTEAKRCGSGKENEGRIGRTRPVVHASEFRSSQAGLRSPEPKGRGTSLEAAKRTRRKMARWSDEEMR